MKVPPLTLNPEMNRPGLALPFSPDILWRYPMSFPPSLAPPASPLMDVKNQMPAHLAADPRLWSREDVSIFLRWFEREFELPSIDIAKFCMNGKALCMLTKADLNDRAPSAGDVLHNTLQFLLRDAPQVPPSPITPHHPLLSPSAISQSSSQSLSLVPSDFHSLGHLLQQNGSVTLSPAPSDQSGGSPRHPDGIATNGFTQNSSGASTGSSHSGTHSDSEDSNRDSSSPQRSPQPAVTHSITPTFSAQALASLKHLTEYKRAAAAAVAMNAMNVHNMNQEDHKPQLASISLAPHSQHSTVTSQTTVLHPAPSQHEEHVETATNGRLLWDFLQQLLNDVQQRYNRYIAWKNRETGVFKIVDPPGLARLWGIQKNHLSMNYDKMSRALRYYYRVNILRKVQGERHCYQFLRNPTELKSIKNISLLRSAPAPSQPLLQQPHLQQPPQQPQPQMLHGVLPQQTSADQMEEEGPTDLSMGGVHNSSQFSQYSQHHSQDHSVAQQPQNLTLERDHKREVIIKTEDYNEPVYE